MTPEQVKAVHAAVQNYERMREESRRLRPDHVKADKVLSDAWDSYMEALNAVGFDDDLIDNLFNMALRYDPDKSTEELTNEWIQSITAERLLN